jgi:hypothetical protein
MIGIETHEERGILAIKASGALNKQDFDKLEPALKNFTGSNSKPKLLMILERFKGWKDVDSFWKDLKLDAKFIGKFDRIAIVGESKWQKWGTRLLSALTKDNMKFFEIENADGAWEWLHDRENKS